MLISLSLPTCYATNAVLGSLWSFCDHARCGFQAISSRDFLVFLEDCACNILPVRFSSVTAQKRALFDVEKLHFPRR